MNTHILPIACLFFLFFTGFLSGCRQLPDDDINADKINLSLYVNKNVPIQNDYPVVAVLEILVTSGGFGEKKDAPEKIHIEASNTERLENGLLQSGFQLVDRSRIDSILIEQNFRDKEMPDKDFREIGKLLGADIVVLGIVTLCQYSEFDSYCQGGLTGVLEVIIKGICVETGEIAFMGVMDNRYCCSTLAKYPYNMGLVEKEMYTRLGKKLKPLLNSKKRD